MFTTFASAWFVSVRAYAQKRFLNESTLSDISSDFGFCLHVELAIPHARRILAFCDFGLIDFWGLKFVFWRKKTDPRPLNAESPPAAKILGPAPWTYPRTFRPSDCFLF